jgi:hypothetical protein
MRFALVLVLGACVGGSGTAPNWPKQHEHDTDGGESLAPHVAAATAVAAAASVEDKPADAVVTPAAVPAAATPAVTTPAATTPTEEPIQTEEIVIEIDD